MNEEDKYVLNFFSDEKLGIPKIEKIFIDYLFNFPILDFIDDYFILFNTLNKQDNEIYKPKKSKDYIFKIKSFSDLKKEIEEILNLFGIYSLELFENKLNELNNFISEIYKNVEEEKKKVPNILKKQAKKDIRERLNNPSNEKINEIMNNEDFKKKLKEEEKKMIDNLEKQKNEKIKNNKTKFENNKKIFEEAIDKLKSSLDNLQNKLIFYNLINEESIKKNTKYENKIELTLSYTKADFENHEENEKYFPIRGGCLPKINNHIFLHENEEFNEKLYKEFTENLNNNKIKINKKKYYVVKTKLRNGFIYNNSLSYFTRTINNNKKIMQILSLSNKNLTIKLKDYKDMSGNSFGFYKILIDDQIGNNIPTKEDLNIENNFGERPELYSILSENPNYIQKLISLPYSDFSSKTEGGLTPLSLALINRLNNIVKILLDSKNINKIGDLNSSNELGLTYLHLAVTNNIDFAVNNLINNGADISLSNRKEENNPIHLMGIYARNEIILNIYKNEKFIQNINNQRPDGKTALHFISSNSILGTKLFILSGADYQIYDTFGNTPAKYAFYSGRFDCYDLLMEKTHDKHDFILRQKIESMILNSKDDKLLRQSLFFQDEIQYDNKISNNMDFKDLINFYEKNDYKKMLKN